MLSPRHQHRRSLCATFGTHTNSPFASSLFFLLLFCFIILSSCLQIHKTFGWSVLICDFSFYLRSLCLELLCASLSRGSLLVGKVRCEGPGGDSVHVEFPGVPGRWPVISLLDRSTGVAASQTELYLRGFDLDGSTGIATFDPQNNHMHGSAHRKVVWGTGSLCLAGEPLCSCLSVSCAMRSVLTSQRSYRLIPLILFFFQPL